MSLLGDLAGSLLGSGTPQQTGQGQGAAGVPAALVGLLSQQGGLQGLLDKFHAAGLGDVAQSWVGTGQSQSVDPSDVHAALGTETVQALAAHTGLPVDELLQQLAQHLPQVVDGLTPSGQVPDQHGGLAELGMSLLRSRFGGGTGGTTPPAST